MKKISWGHMPVPISAFQYDTQLNPFLSLKVAFRSEISTQYCTVLVLGSLVLQYSSALSCWKMQDLPWRRGHLDERICWSKTCIYTWYRLFTMFPFHFRIFYHEITVLSLINFMFMNFTLYLHHVSLYLIAFFSFFKISMQFLLHCDQLLLL